MSDWLPRRNTLWLLFDLSNGDPETCRYVWWFDTKRMALEHKALQLSQRYCADLSNPVKVRLK